MIFGIGVDLVKIERFYKMENLDDFINRFFNTNEIKDFSNLKAKAEYYASRFAVKEAFSKALGTGIKDFALQDLYVTNNLDGKPQLNFSKKIQNILQKKVGTDYNINVSISHESEYAQAFVVIDC